MRRGLVLIVTLLLIFMLGCSGQRAKDGQGMRYSINDQEDVLNYHGLIIENRDKLDAFAERSSGNVRVVHYTTEGDPIFNDLSYKGPFIEMRMDTSQDHYGTPTVTTTTCSRLDKKETATALTYTLEGCDGDGVVDVLHIPFDVVEQDVYEFVLNVEYGTSSKTKQVKEISTFDHRWAQSQPNEDEGGDFQLTQEERQQIYKEMVLANYLSDTPLLTTCGEATSTRYELKVRINGGEQHVKWSNCDRSAHGRRMTDLAEHIMRIIQAREATT